MDAWSSRRVPLSMLALAMVVVGLIRLVPAMPGSARVGTPGPGGADFVGSWRVSISSPPNRAALPGLATFGADGTFLTSDLPVLPAPAGASHKLSFPSLGHGGWHSTGATTAAYTFVELEADEQGNLVDTVTVSGTLGLGQVPRLDCPRGALCAPVAGFRGPFTYTVTLPSGEVAASGTGTVVGNRIVVEAMGTPASGLVATPSG